MGYAGFWKRFAAFILDVIIFMVLSFIIGFAIGMVFGILGMNNPEFLNMIGNVIGIVVVWLYYALMESSSLQGTPGKMALGIKVTDMDGNPIGFLKATGRHFGKYISGMILLIGYIMAGFTEKKQALHDIMAGCLVVNR